MAKVGSGRAVARYVRRYVVTPRYRPEQRMSLLTEDGVRLNAWRLAGPPGADCTVVLVHGFVNSSRSPRIHAFAHRLAAAVNVIVPDLRGHGRSGGRCSMGRLEPLDVAAAVAAAPERTAVVTVGVSLGGGATLLHAGDHGGVAGTVSVSAPAWGQVDREGSRRVRRWVTAPGGRLVIATLLRTRVARDCEYLPDGRDAVGRISPAFTIVVHDPDDWYFGPEHAESVHRWARDPKELWWYPGGGHGTDLLTPELGERLLSEIARRVSGAGGGSAPASP